MNNNFDEKNDLATADNFFKLHGLTSLGFSKDERRASKTPDRRLLKENQTVAYVEVKSPQYDNWLDNKIEIALPMKIVGGSKSDPVFSRLTRHIDKATQQFDAVNHFRNIPNILMFINHNSHSHWGDLHEVLTGHFVDNNGNLHATMLNISEGKIRDSKQKIDCYIWYEKKYEAITAFLFSNESAKNCLDVCNLLGLDFSKING